MEIKEGMTIAALSKLPGMKKQVKVALLNEFPGWGGQSSQLAGSRKVTVDEKAGTVQVDTCIAAKKGITRTFILCIHPPFY